jgi:hypothetical protein
MRSLPSISNVGFFVRPSPEDEMWYWLRTMSTVDKIKELLGPEEVHKFKKSDFKVDRFEIPEILAA